MTSPTTHEGASAYLTVGKVAAELHCSEPTVRRRIRDGELPAVQLGGPGSAVRVPRAGLEAWLYADPNTGGAMPNDLGDRGRFEWDGILGSYQGMAPWLGGDRLPPPRIPPGHPGTCCLRCIAIPLEHSCEGCPKIAQAARDRERMRRELGIEDDRRDRRPWWRRLMTRKNRSRG
jgi:excisionase family DNA binding protein